MNILITTDWYKPVVNGVVTSVVGLADELRKRGHSVKILTLSRSHHTYIMGDVIYMASMGVGKIYPEARLKMPIVRHVMKLLSDWGPDVIHSQCEFSTFFMARKISEETGAPIIHTYHTVYEDYTHYFSPRETWGRAAVRKMTRMVAARVSMMIAPSRKIGDILNSYRVVCPIEVVPSGIDVERFGRFIGTDAGRRIRERYSISPEATVLLYVGRLAKEKNIGELLSYMKAAAAADTVLMIVGGGPYREDIEEMARELELSDKVLFTGMVSPAEVPEYYQAGDLFVSASTSETQGLTYVEALAAGLPLLCRQDKCLADVVASGVNGYEYENSDDFAATLAMWQAMSTEEKKTMRRRAEQSAAAFSSAAFAERMEDIYQSRIDVQTMIAEVSM